MSRPKVVASYQLPDYITGDIEIHLASGQSNAHNHSQGTGTVMPSMIRPKSPDRCLMMNNARSPGHEVQTDFLVGDASALIPYEDSRGTTSSQVTINMATSTVTWPGHNLNVNDNILFANYGLGTFPSNVVLGDSYRVTNPNKAAGTLQITDTLSGPALTFTGTCTSTNIVARNVSSNAPLGQPMGGGLLYWLDDDDPSKTRVYAACGEGGQKIVVIKGDVQFAGVTTFNVRDRTLRMVQNLKNLATARGVGCTVASIMHRQGEADMLANVNTDPGTWEADTLEYMADLDEAIPAITGQTRPIQWFHDIMSAYGSDTGSAGWANGILGKMVGRAVTNANKRTWSTGPSYGYPYSVSDTLSAGAHGINEAQVRIGEAWAEDFALLEAGAGRPKLCRATSFAVSGNVITITCLVPVGSLVIDESTLPAATGTSAAGRTFVRGFELQGGTINSVAVSGSTITITCASSPVGKTLRYAWYGLGATRYTSSEVGRDDCYTPGSWGNIRDSRATPGRRSPLTRRNWLCPFEQVL